MKILTCDLGTKFGWCVTDGITYHSGVWDFSSNRFEGGGMRFLRFETQLEEVLPLVGHVAYEEVRRHMGTDAAHVYGGLQAILTKQCDRREIPYQSIPIGTIKKSATGIGNASKEMMVEAARERWPEIEIIDHNQADALHIAAFVVDQLNLPKAA